MTAQTKGALSANGEGHKPRLTDALEGSRFWHVVRLHWVQASQLQVRTGFSGLGKVRRFSLEGL
ncbi:hypothetical protein [Pseudomonas graminis]|uniref:hypothetical protein n=1 Tax=Pseudomonas graminis TaxID=158627 RepID=UPI001559A774|nr:hypothetical protein [Pseudomonas graminis]